MNIREKAAAVIGYLEKTLSPAVKLGAAALGLGGILLAGYFHHNRTSNVTSPTVMITNLKGNSGGSGVVISTSEAESIVLTNYHVCKVVENGGMVVTTYGESHVVKAYNPDTLHDLCLVSVAAKLKSSATIAPKKPALYETATISGHPALLPNVVTTGHFSNNKVIQVFYGLDKCTDKDMEDSTKSLFCMFFGGIPIIKTYEATVVTALIMAGSSGSAVYNDRQELSGLAFAGAGQLSYAFTVPYEYMRTFLDKQDGNTSGWTVPNYRVDLAKQLQEENKNRYRIIANKCANEVEDGPVKSMCDVIVNTLQWQKQL